MAETYHGKPLVCAWTYYAKDGVPLGEVKRYQNGNGKKDIVPFFKRDGSDWIAGIELNPRPLFGLEKLATHPKDKAVFIVEGEKSAAALQSMGLCAVAVLKRQNKPIGHRLTASRWFIFCLIMTKRANTTHKMFIKH